MGGEADFGHSFVKLLWIVGVVFFGGAPECRDHCVEIATASPLLSGAWLGMKFAAIICVILRVVKALLPLLFSSSKFWLGR